ncbi:MAG TPA: hypothetical protein PLU67_01405 [Candidatus Kapabacteria bacterium]|nr:hypothetical protein [Candidatus Kapabacteria bacterium]HOM04129.1 hypothetical protein [Candidatus Kapabacteria bacterium]HPP38732.1 hypothetical protein [Candidatus Kapabacteria bacterium]
MSSIPSYLNQLLNKHVGNTLFCIWVEANKVTLKSGTLETVLSDKIILKLEGEASKTHLDFFEKDRLIMLNIYNQNGIDLIKAKKPFSLDDKLKVREIKKQILHNVKASLGKEVAVVYKLGDKIALNRGIFANMGISGVVIKPAPFYNTEENIFYRNVLHIYNSEFIDLLEIKIAQGK